MSHMRNEDADQVRASIRELVANSGPARAHVSHLKMVYGKGKDAAQELLAFMQSLRTPIQPMTAGLSPYQARYTRQALLLPQRAPPPTASSSAGASTGAPLRPIIHPRWT